MKELIYFVAGVLAGNLIALIVGAVMFENASDEERRAMIDDFDFEDNIPAEKNEKLKVIR